MAFSGSPRCRLCGRELKDCLVVGGICALCREGIDIPKTVPQKGKLIVLEGIDGGGKSTQMKLLRDFLVRKGSLKVITTHEPSNNPLGQAIQGFLRKEYACSPAVKQLAFTADRGLHLQLEILPRLARGAWVICDRYILSTLVYGASEGLPADLLAKINLQLCEYPTPDLTVIFDISPDTAFSRLPEKEGEREYFEEKERLSQARMLYLNLADIFMPNHVIDAEKDVKTVMEELIYVVQETFFAPVAP